MKKQKHDTPPYADPSGKDDASALADSAILALVQLIPAERLDDRLRTLHAALVAVEQKARSVSVAISKDMQRLGVRPTPQRTIHPEVERSKHRAMWEPVTPGPSSSHRRSPDRRNDGGG
jgi:hypothetical protein